MKFDGNLAWKQASAAVAGNRELLLALAGVFFLLPSLAFALLMPQPQPAPGASQAQMVALMQNYYLSALPFLIPMALVQALGTLTVLTLFTDRSRPTVGQAIKLGLGGIVSYLVAQALLGIGIGVFGSVVLGIAGISRSRPVVLLAFVAVIVGIVYAFVKTSLAAPIIAVERVRNPFIALLRSWQLTRHNSVRICLFYLLLLLAFSVIAGIVMTLTGIVLTIVAGNEVGRIIAAVISSTLAAAIALYFVSVLAAVHRQLAGPSPETLTGPFE